MHGTSGPEVGLAALLTPNGRQWAQTTNSDLMEAMMKSEHVGLAAEVTSDFQFHLI
jgi:hypothetical protein